jgi:hypothetical protein
MALDPPFDFPSPFWKDRSYLRLPLTPGELDSQFVVATNAVMSP